MLHAVPAILVICFLSAALGVLLEALLFEEWHSGWGQELSGYEAVRMLIQQEGLLVYALIRGPFFLKIFVVSLVSCISVAAYLECNRTTGA